MSVNQTLKDRPTNGSKPPNGNDTPDSEGAIYRGPQRPHPSPSIHEDVISRHHSRDPVSRETVYDPIVSRMSLAVGSARLAVEKATKVAEALFANQFITVAARHRAVQDKCHRLTQPVLSDIDNALASCRREIETLETKTSSPPRPTDASGYFLASEVRQRLAAMDEVSREAALSQVLSDDDDAALGAILSASPMLTGITKARQQVLRSAWQKQRFASELERISRLKKALEDTERAGTLTLTYTLGLSSAEIVRRAEASERAVEDALKS